MTAKQAFEIAKKVAGTDSELMQCDEFDRFYGFIFSPNGTKKADEPFGGAYITVGKATGSTGSFSPYDDFDIFDRKKTIDIKNLI